MDKVKEVGKRADRFYVMVQATPAEKAEFKQTAKDRGFNAVSVWMKWLAKKDQMLLRKQNTPRV